MLYIRKTNLEQGRRWMMDWKGSGFKVGRKERDRKRCRDKEGQRSRNTHTEREREVGERQRGEGRGRVWGRKGR